MSVLSDGEIRSLLSDSGMEIVNFREDNLTPNGYDLTISEVFVDGKSISAGEASIPGGTWFAISTKEYVKLPPNVAATLWIRTSWARKGVISSFGMIDAGFEGELTLSAFCSQKDIQVPIGETFAQMVFHSLSRGALSSYGERSGGYQGQKGVTLEKNKD